MSTRTNVVPLLRTPLPELMGDRIRRVRREVGLDQAGFAESIKVGKPLLGAYESGRLAVPEAKQQAIAKRIEKLYGFPALWLVTGNDEDGGPTPNQRLFDGANHRPTAYKSHDSRRGALKMVA